MKAWWDGLPPEVFLVVGIGLMVFAIIYASITLR